MGDTVDDDRRHGMGIVVEYGKDRQAAMDYRRTRSGGTTRVLQSQMRRPPAPDETIEMTFAKDNAAIEGFNRWTINGVAYPMANRSAPAAFHLNQGRRYRVHMRNASDDIHPIHLHRHSFELTKWLGTRRRAL